MLLAATTTRRALLLLILTGDGSSLLSAVAAQQQQDPEPEPKPQVVQPGKSTAPAAYRYLGCYNETTSLANTTGERALYGGINLVGSDEDGMTVEKCWQFCAKSNEKIEYKYAGLEYSRECWCATSLNSLSEKVDDSLCDLGCQGNKTQTCGGSLKLTVYEAGAGKQAVIGWAMAASAVAVGMVLI
ncbi:WSC-domain-containing protein [Cladorrhinum samala]|uniref:WSC-domain-containing protein n=1 Tax=Cladorrhinum samala TaxID=585594 RepID=A0AAV9HIF9_9PEZI|nr:WSC-domain-containing protein [Cladorrhinum samala]